MADTFDSFARPRFMLRLEDLTFQMNLDSFCSVAGVSSVILLTRGVFRLFVPFLVGSNSLVLKG